MIQIAMRVALVTTLFGFTACQSTPTPTAPQRVADGDQSDRVVKSRDGSFEGRIYGNPPASSLFSHLQIGMRAEEVQQILGGPPDDVRSYFTGKSAIPFYFGTDASRIEWLYRGQGGVAFEAGRSPGGTLGVVVAITYDPTTLKQ